MTLSITSLLALLISGCGGSANDGSTTLDDTPPPAQCAGSYLDSGASCVSIDSRDAIVYKPNGEIKGIALFLHGAPGKPHKVSNIFNAKAITNDMQLLSVAPEGSNAAWGWASVNDNATTTDVVFIENLLTKLRAENTVTSDNVYIFGYSAGGFMGYKLACQIPEQITALVALAGQFRGEFTQCTTSTPITVHHFHSPADTDVPMSGRYTGNIKSVNDTLAHWRIINGCDATSNTTSHPGVISSSSGTQTQTWQNCVLNVSFSNMTNVPHEATYDDEILRQIYSPIFN
jgi:polyhydroxybutyrate depolymerase